MRSDFLLINISHLETVLSSKTGKHRLVGENTMSLVFDILDYVIYSEIIYSKINYLGQNKKLKSNGWG